jgi:GNAT superfamily N-acetyltransferase
MQLVRVTDRESRVYADAIAILHQAIAPEAQLPEQRFQELLAGGNYRLFAYAQEEDVQGVALVYFSGELRFAWLDYFAIRSDLRGRGLGSRLFREIVRMTNEQSPKPDWLLFEVDDDYEGDLQREADCKRRVEFYRRLGARVLENVPYKFPSAFAEPIRMRLMVYQLRCDANLAGHDLKQAVRKIFLNIHGRSSDDALMRWFEESLPHTIDMK